MKGLRSIGIKFAVFATTSVLLLVLLINTMLNGLSEDSRDFAAEFSDVNGLRVGDDVKVAGVRVGRVSSIGVTENGAKVDFELVDEQPILTTTRIVMRYQNLLGQRYLGLVQGADRGTELDAGSMIGLSQTNPGFDLTALLNGFRPLFEVLQPEDVNRLATSMVQVLQGEGGTVEQLLQQTTELTTFLTDRDDLYGQVLTNLTPVLQNLDGRGSEITSTVEELRALMEGLARDRESIGSSIDGVSKLVGATSDLLQDTRQPTVDAVRELRQVADQVKSSRTKLNDAIDSFGLIFESLGRAASYENALNVYPCSILYSIGGQEINPAGNNGPWSEVCR